MAYVFQFSLVTTSRNLSMPLARSFTGCDLNLSQHRRHIARSCTLAKTLMRLRMKDQTTPVTWWKHSLGCDALNHSPQQHFWRQDKDRERVNQNEFELREKLRRTSFVETRHINWYLSDSL